MNRKHIWILPALFICAGAWAQSAATGQGGSATFNARDSSNGTTSSGLTRGTMSGGSGNDENAAGASSTMGTTGSSRPAQHGGQTVKRSSKGPARQSADTAGAENSGGSSSNGSGNLGKGSQGSSGTGSSGR